MLVTGEAGNSSEANKQTSARVMGGSPLNRGGDHKDSYGTPAG